MCSNRSGIPWNAHLRFVDFLAPELSRATAARMSALSLSPISWEAVLPAGPRALV